jgi:hypothetical protein
MIAGGNHTQTLRRSAVGLEFRVGIASRHAVLGRVLKSSTGEALGKCVASVDVSHVLKYSNVITTRSRAL